MKDPLFRTIAKATRNSDSRPFAVVNRQTNGSNRTFSVVSGNCIWFNGSEEDCLSRLAEICGK